MIPSPEWRGVVPATAANIRCAAEWVRAGELVIVPTETVYGVAVRPDWPEAMAKLFEAKGREEGKPVAFFAENLAAIRAAGVGVNSIAERLAAAFWPGPLTMVLQNSTGGWDGFRVPDHPVALAWVRELGLLPAVTSANRSGEPAALTVQEAWATLAPHVALALDAGPSARGQASTVVKVMDNEIVLLREGPIRREDLAAAAGCAVREK